MGQEGEEQFNIIGVWFVGNPDKGEPLYGAEAKLITGGTFEFFDTGKMRAVLNMRYGPLQIVEVGRMGTYKITPSGTDGTPQVVVLYNDETHEVFRLDDENKLRRIQSTCGTMESELVMWPIQG